MAYTTLGGGSDWDLTLDSSGEIAVISGAEAVAMDVACACQVFLGECYYDNTLGIPYQTNILGKKFSGAYLAQKLEAEAKKISAVETAVATVLIDGGSRKVSAVIRVTDNEGNNIEVTL